MLTALSLALLCAPHAPSVTPPAPHVAWQRLGGPLGIAICIRVAPAASADPETAPGPGRGEAEPAQWIATLRAAGLTRVIFQAKNPDGFCLWPSAAAPRWVSESPWHARGGDLLRECVDVCATSGMQVGVSIAATEPFDPEAGAARMETQLRELCTNYGSLCEVRFDDATDDEATHAPDESALTAAVALVRQLQPAAVIAGDRGPDVWVTTQAGTRPLSDAWQPREVSVSIRPRWTWRQSDNEHVKSLEQLEELWYATVGQGATLLLNVPIDNRGRIADPDALRLVELRRLLDQTFARELLHGRSVRASSSRQDDPDHAAAMALDGAPETCWIAAENARSASIDVDFGAPQPLNRVELVEAMDGGARIGGFDVDAIVDGTWRRIATGDGIGPRRILRIPVVAASSLRLTVRAEAGPPAIAELRAFAAPPEVVINAPDGALIEPAMVTITSDSPDAEIHYTLDGSTPTRSSPRYAGPLAVERSTRIRAIAWRGDAQSLHPASRDVIRFDPTSFKPAVQFFRAPDAGLRMELRKGGFRNVAEMRASPLVEERVVETLGLPKDRPADQFGLIFEGFINAPTDGIYTFSLRSDDGSLLRLHGEILIDRDDGASWEWCQGRVPLAAGWHPIRLEYFEISGEERLQLRWAGPGFAEENIPAERLAH